MSDFIGRIAVPGLVLSTGGAGISGTQVFPLTTAFQFGLSVDRPIIVHRFGSLDAKQEQTYFSGIGPRKFTFTRPNLSWTDGRTLRAFWESMQGAWKAFTYTVPNADGTSSSVLVTFENVPLSFTFLRNAAQVGLNFVEVIQTAREGPFSISATNTRFPGSTLTTALLSETQEIIPLIHIRVRESAVDDIYLSDRRVTIDGQLYLPRLLGMGEPGSDVLISQDIKGSADNVRFTFGNADRVMTQLSNDTDLQIAEIDLCLYHVNSGVLLQLWKGVIRSFNSDGSAIFPVQCSDGFFQIMNQYPVRQMSRQCWKTFNDGVNCPYSTHGSGGDSSSCDYYWNSANGCLSHGMSHWFGAIPIVPQSAVVKDNSTGFMGFNRNSVTATSIVSDTMWGRALAEIWCNDRGIPVNAFMANCVIAAVRDNGSFFDVLGILGQGPLGAFSITGPSSGSFVTNADGFTYLLAPLADGFPAQGFKIDPHDSTGHSTTSNTALGLRQVPGYLSIAGSQGSGDVAQGYNQFGLANIVGNNAPPLPFTPETAFCELLYVKPAGFNPSTTDTHSLVVPISQGLAGFKWDASDTRTVQGGMTNPFWIAVNTVLRAMGMTNASASDQLALFVRSSLFVGDGSGTAEIADAVVSPLLGTGTEIQFEFQGSIDSQKPLRDWLTEILNVGLGFYVFEFGKLKLGARINASAVDAYTTANILFQSLKLSPIQAAFERMVISYADVAYQYQANTAEYCDKSHAAYYGRAGNPLTTQMHSVGGAKLSQMLRVAATRTREEIGGIDPAEWAASRIATWQTTLLGLGNEAGQVVSLTHADVPGGVGKFRLSRWSLKKDWSVTLEGQTVTDSMYDLDVGPKPFDVTPAPPPALFYPIPLAPAWQPYQIQIPVWDALFPGEWTFDSAQEYTTLADSSVLADSIATGKMPVNTVSSVGAPYIGTITQSTTGGSLPANAVLRVALCVIDANGVPSAASNILIITTSGTGTDTFTLSGIQWPAVAGLQSYVLFAGLQDDLICAQASDPLTATGGGTTYNPTSITFGNAIARSSWGLPSPYISRVRIKAKLVSCSGLLYVPVDGAATNQVICSQLTDTPFTSGQLVGRIVSVVGRPNASTPPLSVSITAYNSSTGALTVSPQAVVSGHPLESFQAGDMVTIRLKADGDNVGNEMQITDAAWVPTGIVSIGDVVRVLQGTGRGQLRKITGLLSTGISWGVPLHLDTSSVWIVEKPSWQAPADSPAIPNSDNQHAVALSLATSNYLNKPILVAGFTVDQNDVESPDGDNPVREDWIFGQLSGGGGGVDTGVPPLPVFTADAAIPGSIHISGVNFAGATDDLQTVSVVQVGVYSEIPPHPPVPIPFLQASIGTGDLTVIITTDHIADYSNLFIIIDNEIIALLTQVSITGSHPAHTTYNCLRGVRGSTAATHTATALVTILSCQTYFYSFVPGFWNPANGTAWETWEGTESLPNAVIAFIDLVLINSVGVSPLATNNYLPAGLLTGTASGASTYQVER